MSKITAIIPTSPIPSHPSTKVIEETVLSIRHHLPDAEILIQIDGVRDEQEHLKDQYNEYIYKLLWKCLHEWKNVLPIYFPEHSHQAKMMIETMPRIKTTLLLYVEHDTPLVIDKKIDWDKCIKFIEDGEASTVRFHFENVIPEEHKKLVMQKKDDFLQTYQWSQRPHLSTVAYYKEIMKHFSLDSRTMIEDKFHGVVMGDWYEDAMMGWHKHRLWIYHPKNGIKRSYHLDARENEPKFEMKY